MDEDIECDKCKKRTPSAKQLTYDKSPEILIIQLKRFKVKAKQTGTDKKGKPTWDYSKRKNNEKVLCPDGLKIIEQRYKLRAWVIHSGTPDGGHYWTEAYAKNGEAYKANDSDVSRIQMDKSHKEDAYILMYERIDK